MTQRRLAGKRCRAVRFINTRNGPVRRGAHGTIRYEMDNLGRHMVFVTWDRGIEGYVFPEEIELLIARERLAA